MRFSFTLGSHTDLSLHRDPSGSLKFSSKAVLHANGVDFSNGQSFKINMDEMEVQGELGKGNYGTVQKVFHRPTGVMMAMKVSWLSRRTVTFADTLPLDGLGEHVQSQFIRSCSDPCAYLQ